MPDRSYPHFAQCAAPGDAHRWSAGSTIGAALALVLGGGTLGAIEAIIIAAVFGGSVSISCFVTSGVIWGAILVIYEFDTWYYSRRLMCILDAQCTVGTLVGTPKISEDGDQKYDVLLAPFTIAEVEDLFRQVIADFPAQYGVGPTDPGSQALGLYVTDELDGQQQKSLYMRVLRERMLSQPGRDYQKKFYVRIEAEMGTAAFNSSDDDTFGASSPNPMFRMDPNSTLAPYLHQELEGNRLHRWLMNVAAGLWAGLIAATALCIACMALGGGTLCAVLTPVIAAIIAFLVWLIAHLVNDPDDGEASQTDVGFADPAFDGDRASIELGDVMLVYGDWIMDTEHDQYFELHPVRAIYLVCPDRVDPNRWVVLDDLTGFPRDQCVYQPNMITEQDRDEMCRLVNDAENPDDTVELRTLRTPTALSMLGGLR